MSIDTHLFLLLPLELQQHIIGQDLTLLCSFSQTNQFYNNLLNIVYYNNYNHLEHNRKSFEQCWLNRPVIVEFCSYRTLGDTLFLIDLNFNLSNHHTYIEFYLNKLDNKVHLSNVIHKSQVYLSDDNKAYLSNDLLTIYYILSKRAQCMKINKNYNKQFILDDLNDQWCLFNNKLKDKNENLYEAIIETYCYLFINIYVFNIYHHTNHKLLLDINNFYDVIMGDITEMYNKIKDAINKL